MPRPYTYPDGAADCVLVEIPRPLVPYVAGALRPLERPWNWASPEDWRRAYNALNVLRGQMMTGCASDIVAAVDRLYRLVDETLTGRVYTAEYDRDTGELLGITPPVPDVPAGNTPSGYDALLLYLLSQARFAANAAVGAEFLAGVGSLLPALTAETSIDARLLALQGETGGFFGFGAKRVQLRDLLQAGRINDSTDEGLISDALEEVLGVTQDVTGIGGVLASVLGTAADAATDGGVIATQVAIGAAQALTAGALGAQVDALSANIALLTQALTGGTADDPPAVAPPDAGYLRDSLYVLSSPDITIDAVSTPLSSLLVPHPTQGPPNRAADILLRMEGYLNSIRRGLVRSDEEGAITPLLELALTQLECICEGVNGPAPSFPPFNAGACDPLDTQEATSVAFSYDANGFANVYWDVIPGASIVRVAVTDPAGEVPGTYDLLVFDNTAGGRQVCFQLVSDNGSTTDTPVVNLRPIQLADGASGGRPSETFSAGSTTLTLSGIDAQGDPIGWLFGISFGGSAPPTDGWRIYVGVGALG